MTEMSEDVKIDGCKIDDCNVCLDKFTPVLKRPISCPYCDLKTCLVCMKSLALMWASDPKCASCKKPFSADNLDAMFTRAFRRGQLRIQLIQNLQEQEMSLLPETSEFIAITAAQAEYRVCINLLRNVNLEFENNPLSDINIHVNRVLQIQNRIRAVGLHSTTEKKTVSNSKSVKCPYRAGLSDECRGYIVSGGSCGLCKTKLCKECNVSLTAVDGVFQVHECKEEDISNWALIKETTVGCPKCGTRIQKISGCNQMWCTVQNCNTAFDWATGRVVNGPVHNPHYHQWLANGGGAGLAPEQADIACQGPRGVVTNQRIRRLYAIINPVIDISRDLHRRASAAAYSAAGAAIQGTPQPGTPQPVTPQPSRANNGEPIVFFAGILQGETPLSRTFAEASHYIRCIAEAVDLNIINEPYSPMSHRDLRIDFLQNKITKAQWASKMSHRETIRLKQTKCRELHVMFQSACADIFARLYTDFEKINGMVFLSHDLKISDFLNCLVLFNKGAEGLRLYYNSQIVRILSDYSDKGARVLDFRTKGRPETLMWFYREGLNHS
jgi:hypothetical protein